MGPSTSRKKVRDMTEPSHILAAVAEQLGLDGEDEDAVYGCFDGFPVAASTLGASGEFGVLIQIRHHYSDDELASEDSFEWDDDLKRVLADGQVKFEIEGGIAWLTVFQPEPWLAKKALADLMDRVMAGLSSAGIESLGNVCHYCRSATVQELTYAEGRVAQMCDACLAPRRRVQDDQTQISGMGVAGALVIGSMASVIGAVVWAGCWIADFVIVNSLSGGQGQIVVPQLLVIGEVVTIGGLSGGAVGLVVSRISQGGYHFGAIIGLLGVLAAVLMGECVIAAWIVISQGVPFSPVSVLVVAILLWTDAGLENFVYRAFAVLMSLVCAYFISKPKLKALGL